MKKFLSTVIVVLAVLVGGVYASDLTYSENLVNETNGVPISKTYTLDLDNNQIDYLSMQAVYSSMTYVSTSFTDGTRSTGTITVSSNTALTGATLTINGQVFTNGIDWATATTSSGTAQNIYNVISATLGAYATGYLIVNSTYNITGSSFTLMGSTFTAGTDFAVGGTTATQAQAILGAINAKFLGTPLTASRTSGTLNFWYTQFSAAGNVAMTSYSSSFTVAGLTGGQQVPISGITFTWPNSSTVIYATATVVGTSGNYTFASSTPTALIATSMTGGVASAINNSLHTISGTANYPTALPLLYVGTTIAGLTTKTTYYAMPYTSSSFMLATSKVNASTGAFVYITSFSTAGGSSYTLSPIALIDNATFYWQYSNDGTNFLQIPAISSVTANNATVANTSTFWDFAKTNFRWLRVNYLAPTWGAIKLVITGNGSKVAP